MPNSLQNQALAVHSFCSRSLLSSSRSFSLEEEEVEDEEELDESVSEEVEDDAEDVEELEEVEEFDEEEVEAEDVEEEEDVDESEDSDDDDVLLCDDALLEAGGARRFSAAITFTCPYPYWVSKPALPPSLAVV